MKNRYRIIPDIYLGYEAQVRLWYWPFWRQIQYVGYVNTSFSIKDAKKIIEWHKNGGKPTVYYEE